MVDDREQAVPIPNFNWQQIPAAKCIDWKGQRVTGTLTCSGQVEFIRELAHPRQGVWELVDKFTGHDESHKVSWFFHFAAGLTLRWVDISENLIVEERGKPYFLVFPPKGVCVEVKRGWVSYSYGNKETNAMLQASWRGKIPSNGINFCWKFLNVQ
jgi:hypothetical protein